MSSIPLLNNHTIKYVYDDATENLLDQYSNQLAQFEQIFENKYGKLPAPQYAQLRDQDPAMLAILDVIAKIYEQAIPINIEITSAQETGSANGTDGGIKH